MIYKIGYGTCEESDFWWFENDTEYDLNRLMTDILYEIYREYKVNHNITPNFADLMLEDNLMVEKLEAKGFKQIKPDRDFIIFGWAKCNEPGDWEGYTSELEKGIQKEFERRDNELS